MSLVFFWQWFAFKISIAATSQAQRKIKATTNENVTLKDKKRKIAAGVCNDTIDNKEVIPFIN